MGVVIIQANYDELESIAARFGQWAESNAEMGSRVQQGAEKLTSGDWIGKGAEAFSKEMDSEVLPAVERLTQALQQSQSVAREIILILQQAEEEAAAPFRDGQAQALPGSSPGGADTTGLTQPAGPGLGPASPAGTRPAAGPGGDSPGGLTPEGALIRDQLRAVDTARKAASVLGNLLPAARVTNLVNSLGFRLFGSSVSGLASGFDAAERGVSTPAAVADGLVGGLITLKRLPGMSGGMSIASNIAAVVHGVTTAISPEAGKYTAIAYDVMPDQVGKQIAFGAIDTVDALARGDHDQLVRHHEQNLAGNYGEVIRGYAIGAEAVGALVTGDQRALDQLSDAAAEGKLGKLAQFGDWLGGAVYDLFN